MTGTTNGAEEEEKTAEDIERMVDDLPALDRNEPTMGGGLCHKKWTDHVKELRANHNEYQETRGSRLSPRKRGPSNTQGTGGNSTDEAEDDPVGNFPELSEREITERKKEAKDKAQNNPERYPPSHPTHPENLIIDHPEGMLGQWIEVYYFMDRVWCRGIVSAVDPCDLGSPVVYTVGTRLRIHGIKNNIEYNGLECKTIGEEFKDENGDVRYTVEVTGMEGNKKVASIKLQNFSSPPCVRYTIDYDEENDGDDIYEEHILDSRYPERAFAFRFSERQGMTQRPETERAFAEDSDDSGMHSDHCCICRDCVHLIKCPACSKSFHWDCKSRDFPPEGISDQKRCPLCEDEGEDIDEDEDEEERRTLDLEEEKANEDDDDDNELMLSRRVYREEEEDLHVASVEPESEEEEAGPSRAPPKPTKRVRAEFRKQNPASRKRRKPSQKRNKETRNKKTRNKETALHRSGPRDLTEGGRINPHGDLVKEPNKRTKQFSDLQQLQSRKPGCGLPFYMLYEQVWNPTMNKNGVNQEILDEFEGIMQTADYSCRPQSIVIDSQDGFSSAKRERQFVTNFGGHRPLGKHPYAVEPFNFKAATDPEERDRQVEENSYHRDPTFDGRYDIPGSIIKYPGTWPKPLEEVLDTRFDHDLANYPQFWKTHFCLESDGQLFSKGISTINTKTHSNKMYQEFNKKVRKAHMSERTCPASCDYSCGLEGVDYKDRIIMDEIKKWDVVPQALGPNHSGAKWELRNYYPQEAELFLNLPQGHTTGVSATFQRQALGNLFDPHVVAYLLEPLAEEIRPPRGESDAGVEDKLVVLSLFDGLGAAAVALQKLGLLKEEYLDSYWTVEIDLSGQFMVERFFLQHFGDRTGDKLKQNQEPDERGQAKMNYDITDKNQFYSDKAHLQKWVMENKVKPRRLLVIGGSPCNNMAGTNNMVDARQPGGQCNLKGNKSKLFFVMTRIIRDLKEIFEEDALYD